MQVVDASPLVGASDFSQLERSTDISDQGFSFQISDTRPHRFSAIKCAQVDSPETLDTSSAGDNSLSCWPELNKLRSW